MKYTPRHYAEAYLDLSKDQSVKDLISLTKNFWRLVYSHKRFTWRNKILQEVIKLWNERQGIKRVELALGRQVVDNDLEVLRDQLSQKLGKEVELNTVIKPHLLGGLVLQIDDSRWDVSLKGRLDKLYTSLSGQNDN
ncbi:MAG: F0F1 ATP synthase subunit delta [Patescibacteria group bacterium]